MKLIFATTLIAFATISIVFAAPPLKHLDRLVDTVVDEISRSQPRTVNEITLKGLDSLRRVKCQLKDDNYRCSAVAEKATVSKPGKKDLPVNVRIPITVETKGDTFQRLVIGDAHVKLPRDAKENRVAGFWNKLKNSTVKSGKETIKILKSAGVIASDAAKEAVKNSGTITAFKGKTVTAIYEDTQKLSADARTNATRTN